jgi:hypothetical protein
MMQQNEEIYGEIRAKRKGEENQVLEVVPRGGIEPPTPAFSVPCSTD